MSFVVPLHRKMYYTVPGKLIKSNLNGSEGTVLLDNLEQPVGILIRRNKELMTTDTTRNEIRITTLDGNGHNSSSFILSAPSGIAYAQDKFTCVGTGKSLACAKETSPLVFTAVYSSGSEWINYLLTPGFNYIYGNGIIAMLPLLRHPVALAVAQLNL